MNQLNPAVTGGEPNMKSDGLKDLVELQIEIFFHQLYFFLIEKSNYPNQNYSRFNQPMI